MKIHFHQRYQTLATYIDQLIKDVGTQPGGFLYAGRSGKGELKVGRTSRCPLCRMDEQALGYVGISWADNAYISEAELLKKLGPPVRGREWFGDVEGRTRYLIDNGMVWDCDRLMSTLIQADTESRFGPVIANLFNPEAGVAVAQ